MQSDLLFITCQSLLLSSFHATHTANQDATLSMLPQGFIPCHLLAIKSLKRIGRGVGRLFVQKKRSSLQIGAGAERTQAILEFDDLSEVSGG